MEQHREGIPPCSTHCCSRRGNDVPYTTCWGAEGGSRQMQPQCWGGGPCSDSRTDPCIHYNEYTRASHILSAANPMRTSVRATQSAEPQKGFSWAVPSPAHALGSAFILQEELGTEQGSVCNGKCHRGKKKIYHICVFLYGTKSCLPWAQLPALQRYCQQPLPLC